METMGPCLICLQSQTSPQLSPTNNELPESLTVANSSIHILFRLLKVDLEKSIFQNKSSPPILQPKLKLLLCEECTPLIKKMEIIYRQLEKLEMNLESHLSFVHAKLLEAEGESDMESEGMQNELGTLNTLRTEVINKCSLKLRCSGPRVKIQKLSPGTIFKIHKRKFGPGVNPHLHDAMPLNMIKAELSVVSDLELEADARDTFPDDGNADSCDYTNVTVQKSEDADLGVPSEQKCFHNPQNKVKNTSSVHSNVNVGVVPCQQKTTNDEQKCPICLKKFSYKSCLARHIRLIHQEVRAHSCTMCDKKFRAKFELKEHHRVVHQGIAPKCLKCHKVFANKSSLIQHQKTISCTIKSRTARKLDHSNRKEYKFCCRICKDKFRAPSDLKRHFNSAHLKLKNVGAPIQ